MTKTCKINQLRLTKLLFISAMLTYLWSVSADPKLFYTWRKKNTSQKYLFIPEAFQYNITHHTMVSQFYFMIFKRGWIYVLIVICKFVQYLKVWIVMHEVTRSYSSSESFIEVLCNWPLLFLFRPQNTVKLLLENSTCSLKAKFSFQLAVRSSSKP